MEGEAALNTLKELAEEFDTSALSADGEVEEEGETEAETPAPRS